MDLIRRGIDVNSQNVNGQTPLHCAALYGNLKLADEMLAHGGDPNARDVYGNSPLWTAVFNARGHYDIVESLVGHGADSATKNKAGRSPLYFGRQILDDQIVTLLTALRPHRGGSN
jgi:ankyrin repeat protein